MTQSNSKAARTEIRVENLSQEQTLVTRGRVADGFWTRMKGLLGSKPLAEVVAIHREMAPWRFGKIHRGAHFVIELPAGTVTATGTQKGDQLQVQGYEF